MNFLPRFIRKSIKNKVFASFLVILLLLTTIFVVSRIVILRLGEASDKILKMNYNSIIYAIEMLQEVNEIDRYSHPSQAGVDSLLVHKQLSAQTTFAAMLGRSRDNVTEPGESQILDSIEEQYTRYIIELNKYSYNQAGQSSVHPDEVEGLRLSLMEKIYSLLEVNQTAMFSKSAKAQRIAGQGSVTLVVVFVLVFLLGLTLSYGLANRIVNPIYRLVDATQDVAKGDYSKQIAYISPDELGELVSKFNFMTQKLTEYNKMNLKAVLEEKKKIDAIFSSINDGILFIGTDYRILDVNDQALSFIALKRSEVVNHHFLEIIKNEKMFSQLKACIEETTAPEQDENSNITTLKKDQFLQYFFSPVASEQGDFLGALLLIRDVSDLKELERLKSEFVMIVSHELKTPLTSINMSIDLLRESMSESISPANAELLDIAKEDVVRLKNLVSDLLNLSKIEAGKIDLNITSVDLSVVVSQVCLNFKSLITQKNITLVQSYTASALPLVNADEDKLLWIYSNLLSNAIKAVKDKGTIELNAEVAGKFVVVSIKDDGVGIPLSFQKKIFEKFVQIPGQNDAQGTGLGLMICKEIIRAHGGTIWVESEPGKGTVFAFTIPIVHSGQSSIFNEKTLNPSGTQ
ncbi:MAG: ATP-binding protein [Candidatus Cloacimonadota bacterium]